VTTDRIVLELSTLVSEDVIARPNSENLQRLHLTRSSAEVSLMRAIKLAIDPNGILNPGKIF
jgi:hypothetical protein